MLIIKTIGVFITVCVVAGCAALGGDPAAMDEGVPRIDTAGMQKGCFRVDDVDDSVFLTKLNLLVYAPTRSRPYLLTITPPAELLGGGSGIGFQAGEASGRLCGRVGDSVIIREGVARSYQVIDVRELDDATAKRLVSEAEAGTLQLVVPSETGSAGTAAD